MAIFLDDAPPKDTLAAVRGQKDEEIKLGKREIYVHYGEGMGTIEARHPRREDRHRAQHEYGRGAREDGRRDLS